MSTPGTPPGALRERLLRPARGLRAMAAPAAVTRARLEPTRPASTVGETLTVLSANLWHDWPRGRRLRERLDAFAELVAREDVDVVLLQEVARSSLVEADEHLADRLGMAFAYARANGHLGAIGFEEGVAVFSRFRLAEPRVVALGPGRGRVVKRLALAARVEAGSTAFWAVSVHLGLRRRANVLQMRALAEWVDTALGDAPAVIGGDFNAPEGSPALREAQRRWVDAYRALHPEGEATTFELRAPWGRVLRRWRLDYVFVRPAARAESEAGRQMQAGVRAREPVGGDPSKTASDAWRTRAAHLLDAPGGVHSDHRAVLVRIAFPDSPSKSDR